MNSIKRMIDNALPVCQSKTKIAECLGDSPQTLYNWENGLRKMPAAKIMKLATLANMNAITELGRYEAEWLQKKLSGAAAGIAVASFSAVVLFAGLGGKAEASQYPALRESNCTLCAALRRIARRVAGLDWVKRHVQPA